jgi:hypothetical protein
LKGLLGFFGRLDVEPKGDVGVFPVPKGLVGALPLLKGLLELFGILDDELKGDAGVFPF